MNDPSLVAPLDAPATRRPHPLRGDAFLLALAVVAGCDDTESSDSTPLLDRPDDADGGAEDDAGASSSSSGTETGTDGGSGSGGEPGPDVGVGSDASTDSGPQDGSDTSGGTDSPNTFDDEFDGAADLLVPGGPWQRLFPEQAGSMIEGAPLGVLSVTASAAAIDNSWYFDYHGAALVKEVTGNFAIMTSLTTTSPLGGDAQPAGIFNSGGLLIRDVLAAPGSENWMTFNVGRQSSAYGRELKKTVASGSNYFLNAQASNAEHLLVCRLGAEFRFYHWDDDLGAWEAERFDNQVPTPGGVATTEINELYDPSRNPELALPAAGGSIPLVFEFASLPETVQVGVMMNSWGAPHDVTSEFDYIRMSSIVPRSATDCTVELTPG